MAPAAPLRKSPDDVDAGRMGFLEHLDELRTRLIRSLVAVGVGMGVAFFFNDEISVFVLGPVGRALPPGTGLVANGLTEGFGFYVDLALVGGVLLAAPFVTYQVWRFVAPGLYATEKRLVLPLVVMAAICTLAGAAFSHYLLFPSSVWFLSRLLPKGVVLLPSLHDAFELYKGALLAMVIVFQLPTLIFLLARLNAVSAGFLWRNFKYAFLISFIASAVLTATGDPGNQVLVAVPMLAMYVLSIGIAWLVRPRRTDDVTMNDADAKALGLVISATVFEQARRRRNGERRRERRSFLVS
jgi:sec-independent protein translocase protein TatC